MARRLACTLLLVVSLASVAHAESVSGRINPNRDKLFVFQASSFNQAVITAMWRESGTDCDLLAFILDEDGEVLPLGVGVSSTENLERLVVGIGQGVDIYVLVQLFSGEATSFQLNTQSTHSDDLAQLRGAGLRELSEDDPRIAPAAETLRRIRKSLNRAAR